MSPLPKPLALFDLDGTLTDPRVGIVRSTAYALQAVGVPERADDELASFIGLPLQDVFPRIGVSADVVPAAVAAYRERYAELGLFENALIPGIPDVLAALQADDWRLVVATSKPTVFAERIVRHFEIATYFDFVGGATLDGLRRSKADVIGFALTQVPVFTTAVMVGDRREDALGAQTHGLDCVGVTWGFGSAEELRSGPFRAVVDTTDELLGQLRQVLV